MLGRRFIISALLVASLVACKGKSADTTPPASDVSTAEPGAPSGASSDPAPTAADPAADAPASASGRPAVVTDEMVAVAEKMVTAMESMGADLTAAGTNCAKGAAVLRTYAKKLQPIAQEAKKFQDIKDPAADKWFEDTYAPRMMAAMGGFTELAKTCASDKDFMKASEEFGAALEM